jgi:hypothetical protein
MFYFALIKKNGEYGKWIEINRRSIEDAKEFVKAYCIVSSPKKKLSDYKIISKEEYDELLEEQKQKEIEALRLDDRATKVVINFLNWKLKDIDEDDIKEYSLKEDTEKPYYAQCFWGSGSNGSFCNKEDLKDLFAQKAGADYDEGFSISVYDIDADEQIIVEERIDVKLFVDGKEL